MRRLEIGRLLDILPSLMCALPCRITLCLMWPSRNGFQAEDALDRHGPFHLGCEITENGEALEVVWLFRPNLFSEEEINNLGSLFEAVLARVARMPESRTAALTI